MRDQPRDDRARPAADARRLGRPGDRRRAGSGERVAPPAPPEPLPVRLNRYLAAAGLGTRREVEGLIRTGRVTVAGAPASGPYQRVQAGEAVLVDGVEPHAPAGAAVLLHKPRGSSAVLVHPPGLRVVMPLKRSERGAELLVGDEGVARRIADPRFPQPQVRDGSVRLAYAGLELGDLAPGEWRPLGHKEVERLRRAVRLPPR